MALTMSYSKTSFSRLSRSLTEGVVLMNLTEAINQIRSSIVQICFSATELSPRLQQQTGAIFLTRVLGAGFFINSDAPVITARHVIQEGRRLIQDIEANNKRMLVGIGLPNSENFRANTVLLNFDVVDENQNSDLALLKLSSNPFQGEVSSGIRIGEKDIPVPAEVARLNPNRPKEGQWVAISGYPFGERVLVTNSGHVASAWTSPNFLIDAEVNSGNSGGPVYLVEDASVVGMCIAYKGSPVWREGGKIARILDQPLYYSSGLTEVVPASRIIDMLERNELSFSLVAHT